MNIESIIKENKKILIQEDMSLIRNAVKTIKSMSWDKAKKILQKSFRDMVKIARKNNKEKELLAIINTLSKNQYKKLTDVKMNEGIGEFWDEAKGSFYGATSFYPLLQAFLELDKVVKGTDTGADISYVGIYGLMWAAIVGGKVITSKLSNKSDKRNDIGKSYMEM